MTDSNSGKSPLLVRALRGEKTERVPIWFMRQAGRYLPEYNEIRKGLSFIELTQNPDLAFEVTIQPHRRFQVDGLIMFADILTPLHGAGVPLYFEEKKGPILEKVVATESDLEMIADFDPVRDTGYVKALLNKLRSYADGFSVEERPGVLGFAGAPFTMASYLIEGGTTKKFEKIKRMMFAEPELFAKLGDRIADMTIEYLRMQLREGADAVQLFDSWGGILSIEHYREFSAPYTNRIIQTLRKEFPEKPIILFVGNAAHLLPALTESGASVISLDWRVDPDNALKLIPGSFAIQGNMDPLVLYGKPDRVKKEVTKIINKFKNRPGYIFNLGHGIHPGSPMECVEAMVSTVRSEGRI